MAALPYIQLYPADYLADTVHLSCEEHGAYLLIIFNYWQTGKPVPENRMPGITRLPADRWDVMRDTLAEFFEVDDGFWRHDRIEDELQKVKSKSIKASRAGKKSAASRSMKNKGNSTNVEQPPERTLNHTEADTEAEADTSKNNTSKPASKSKRHPPCPMKEIIDMYNETLTPALPFCDYPTEGRPRHAMVKQIRKLWQTELKDKAHWQNFFTYVEQSDFLMGRLRPTPGHENWRASLEWITKPAKYTKIHDGEYHR